MPQPLRNTGEAFFIYPVHKKTLKMKERGRWGVAGVY
jgi:hypothetical protein